MNKKKKGAKGYGRTNGDRKGSRGRGASKSIQEAGVTDINRPGNTKHSGEAGGCLTEVKQVLPQGQSQEQRLDGEKGFHLNSGGSGQGGSSVSILTESKPKGQSSMAAAPLSVLGKNDKGTSGRKSGADDSSSNKGGSCKSTKIINAECNTDTNNGSDCIRGNSGGHNTTDSESGGTEKTVNSSCSSRTKGGITSFWERKGDTKDSRAHATAATGKAAAIVKEKSSAAAAGTELSKEDSLPQCVSVGGTIERQGGGIYASATGEREKQQEEFGELRHAKTDQQPETGRPQQMISSQKECMLGAYKEETAADQQIAEEHKSVLAGLLQWGEQWDPLYSIGNILSNAPTTDSDSCWLNKDRTTKRPCQLVRSRTAIEGGIEGLSSAGGQRPLLYSYSLGSASTQPTGEIRAAGKGRLRHSSSLKAFGFETEESHPLKSSALALQSALVSLLQVQEERNGGSGRTSKPVMPRRNLMCTSMLRTGVCANPERCNYAHNLVELQKKLELRKTSLCKYWVKGKCENEDCNFAHGEHELKSTEGVYKTTICKYWKQGACYSGSNCRHAHGEDDLRPERLPTHLERKRLQQLQKAPWRSSSFTPSTTTCQAATPSMLERAQSALDVKRLAARSEKKGGGARRCVFTKSIGSGALSQLPAPLHRQDGNASEDLHSLAAQVLAEIPGGADSIEALSAPFYATGKKSILDSTVGTDAASFLNSSAADFRRVLTSRKDDSYAESTFKGSIKQSLTGGREKTGNTNYVHNNSPTLLEKVAAETGLNVDQVLQLGNSILASGVGTRSTSSIGEGGEQRPREYLRGSAASEAAAAALVRAAESQRGTPVQEPEFVAGKETTVHPTINDLMSSICSSLLELQLHSNDNAVADNSAGVSVTNKTASSDKHGYLPALLRNISPMARQEWTTAELADASPFSLTHGSNQHSTESKTSCAASGMLGTLSESFSPAATLQSENGRYSIDGSTAMADIQSKGSSCLQDILSCSEILSRGSLVAGCGKLDSLDLQQVSPEQTAAKASPPTEANKVAALSGLSISPPSLSEGVYRGTGSLLRNTERDAAITGKQTGDGTLDSYTGATTLGNSRFYAGARAATPAVTPGLMMVSDGERDTRRTVGDGGFASVGSSIPLFTLDGTGDSGAVNKTFGETLRAFAGGSGEITSGREAALRTDMYYLTDYLTDNRFSSACWRATDADVTLLHNQRNSGMFQLEAPLHRSPTLPSVSDYVDDSTGAGRCRTDTEDNAALLHGIAGCSTSAGKKGDTNESGLPLWPSTPGFTFAELLERGAQACSDSGENTFEMGGASGASSSVAALSSGITGVRKQKDEQYMFKARSVWGHTTFTNQNNIANAGLQTVIRGGGAASTSSEDDIFAKLSDITAFRVTAAETDLHLREKNSMFMQPLKENADECEEEALYAVSMSREDGCVSRGGGTYSTDGGGVPGFGKDAYYSGNSGAGGTSCNMGNCGHLQHDDASFSISSRGLSTAGEMGTPSGGGPTISGDCGSPSSFSDSGGSGKIRRKLLDFGSSSSTIFPP